MSPAGLGGERPISFLCHSYCTCYAHSPSLQIQTIQGPSKNHHFTETFLDFLPMSPHTPPRVWSIFSLSLLQETFIEHLCILGLAQGMQRVHSCGQRNADLGLPELPVTLDDHHDHLLTLLGKRFPCPVTRPYCAVQSPVNFH